MLSLTLSLFILPAGNNARIREIVFQMHFNGGDFMTKYWYSVVSKTSSDTGNVTFPEFVFGFWNLLSLRPLQKTYDKFTFDLYSEKGGRNQGSMSSNSAKVLLDHIYGTKKDSIYKKANKSLLDTKSSGWYTLPQWSEFTENNEGVLMPLQDLQKKERFKLLGKSYWEKKVDARKKFSRGKSYLTLAETLAMNGISTGPGPVSSGGSRGGGSSRSLKSGSAASTARPENNKLVRKSSSKGKLSGMGPRSQSQSTLSQGGSSNSISVDG